MKSRGKSSRFQRELLAGSRLFDSHWYLETYSDVREAGIDPLSHYISYGANEGRKPSALFDVDLYVFRHPEAKSSDITPLSHFLLSNIDNGDYVLSSNTVQRTKPHPEDDIAILRNVLRYSHEEDRALLGRSRFFDENFYKSGCNGVDWSTADAIDHYLNVGAPEGKRPSKAFDPTGYGSRHPELRANQNPLLHFLRRGAFFLENSIFFDARWYLHTYSDVAKADMDPLYHYLEFGAQEGRNPSPRFIAQASGKHFPHDLSEGDLPLLDLVFRRFADLKGVSDFKKLQRRPARPASGLETPDSRRNSGPLAVFVTHDLNTGGAPLLLASIVSWFARSTNYQVKIVALGNGNLAEKFSALAPLLILGKTSFSNEEVGPTKRTIREFLGQQPAFTFMNSVASAGYCSVDPFNSPRIAYFHEMSRILHMYADCVSAVREGVDAVVCGSDRVKEALVREFDFVADQLHVRPAFIEASAEQGYISPYEKSARRKALGWEPGVPLVAACGIAHWRKQPDAFVRIAAKVIKERNLRVNFVWIGDGDDVDECRALAEKMGVGDYVKFVGHQSDIMPVLRASDVFALTSLEDPFPLVCLDAAMASCPSVVYGEATGITRMTNPEGAQACGVTVELNDEEEFADTLFYLLNSEDQRELLAKAGVDRVKNEYSVDVGCQELLGIIRNVAQLKPEVSVVVPNYNYANYLDVRLRSIVQQEFQDIEIILLDDASTDDSVSVLEKFCSEHSNARLYRSDSNVGSVFKAWEKGIKLATGRLIWIAEADDWCEDTFLRQVVDQFQYPGTLLCHGRSIPINADGAVTGDWNDLYLDQLAPGRWTKSFSSYAQREVDGVLGWANSIPNASAVVVEASAARKGIELAVQFKLAGDWAFYLASAVGGIISYCHDAVNYHRRHVKSVTHSVEGTKEYFRELASIGALADNLYGKCVTRQQALLNRIAQEARRFSYIDGLPAADTQSGLTPRLPGILYGVGDLGPGGAQMFAIRFVNEWRMRQGNAALFVAGAGEAHISSLSRLIPGIPIMTEADIERSGGLSNFMDSAGLKVLISGHWWADRAFGRMLDLEGAAIPWMIIMHGCYENVLSTPEAFPDMKEAFERAERGASHWVWTAKKNKAIFERGYIRPRGSSHIVSGFQPEKRGSLTRRDVGIPEDAVVFTIASRALESKGWLATLDAFKDLHDRTRELPPTHLLMIGDGPVLEHIDEAALPVSVTLIPHVSNLADYISLSDVCVLPSWFPGESLPLVLLEFLSQKKPAIVSTIGECSWCITDETSGRIAGAILERDVDSGKVSSRDIAEAMINFMRSPTQLLEASEAAGLAFRKFDLDRMMDSYVALVNGLSTGERLDKDSVPSVKSKIEH